MIDPKFYEEHMNKLIVVRRFLILFVFILILSVFIIAYLSFNKEIKEGYAIFHGFFAILFSIFLSGWIDNLSFYIGNIRVDFYNSIRKKGLTFEEYQQQKEGK